jgi:hypothetical protein
MQASGIKQKAESRKQKNGAWNDGMLEFWNDPEIHAEGKPIP